MYSSPFVLVIERDRQSQRERAREREREREMDLLLIRLLSIELLKIRSTVDPVPRCVLGTHQPVGQHGHCATVLLSLLFFAFLFKISGVFPFNRLHLIRRLNATLYSCLLSTRANLIKPVGWVCKPQVDRAT